MTDTPKPADGEQKSTRKQVRKTEKSARKLAREQARAFRVAVSEEREMDPEALAQWLEAAAKGLRAGHLSVAAEGHEALLMTTGPACVRIKARRGRRRMRLSLRAVWTPEEPAPTAADGT